MDPITILLIAGLAGFVILGGSSAQAGDAGGPINPNVTTDNKWNLPDIDPANQLGTYTRDYDEYIQAGASKYNVPFALAKAHIMRESNGNPNAKNINTNGSGDYGLMQVNWTPGSNRFSSLGYPDDQLQGGSRLFDPTLNCEIGCSIIKDNLNRSQGAVRDAINMYNTGKTEAQFEAPNNYVDDVLNNYSNIVGQEVS